MAQHDQRFKALLQAFFPDFMTLFFPEDASQFDFSTTEWLDKEQLLHPPSGEVLEVDLLARVRFKEQPDDETLAVVHIEVESRDAVATFHERMYEYYQPLWYKYRNVLPVALYLRVGLDGIGVGTFVARVGKFEVNRFRYLYVGLPGLDAEPYLRSHNRLAIALSALMGMPRDQRPQNRADALLELTVECQEHTAHCLILTEVVNAYLTLDAEQQRVFEELLKTEPYRRIEPMYQTVYEKAVAEGRAQERREFVRKLLERQFGPLPAEAVQRLETWPLDRLEDLAFAAGKSTSLQELGLTD